MNSLLDIFNQFTDHYMQSNGWDSPASVWSWDDDNSEWNLVEDTYDDPYDLIPTFVAYGYEGTSMLLLYGWGAPYVDKNDPRPSLHPEKIRVRSLTYLTSQNDFASFQPMGEPLTEVDEDPQGNIIDIILQSINNITKYLDNKKVHHEQN